MTGPMDYRERIGFSLRALYEGSGYTRYRMSKFEEYDLYARNKDFLADPRAITFSDPSGQLLALKPDVTLSIVKNTRDDDSLRKLYYTENVYRVSGSTGSFRELMQMGLECLGQIDDYCICEVLTLAVQSLLVISDQCVLDISHIGLLSDLLDAIGIPTSHKPRALTAIGEKNRHELAQLCRDCGRSEAATDLLIRAVALSGPPEEVLPQLCALLENIVDTGPLTRLQRICAAVEGREILRFDFSAVDNLRYYNGIILKGFLRGLPGSILSGGQYDRLMERMGRSAGALGFAVYMDDLAQLAPPCRDYDADILLLYGSDTPLPELQARIRQLQAQGNRVLAQREPPKNLRCRQILSL